MNHSFFSYSQFLPFSSFLHNTFYLTPHICNASLSSQFVHLMSLTTLFFPWYLEEKLSYVLYSGSWEILIMESVGLFSLNFHWECQKFVKCFRNVIKSRAFIYLLQHCKIAHKNTVKSVLSHSTTRELLYYSFFHRDFSSNSFGPSLFS